MSYGLQGEANIVVVRVGTLTAAQSRLDHRFGEDLDLLIALKLLGSGKCLCMNWINHLYLCLIDEAGGHLSPLLNRLALGA